MNNIEFRLILERLWREENLLLHIPAHRKNVKRRSLWTRINNNPSLSGILSSCNDQIFR